jgi:hypothetical protein
MQKPVVDIYKTEIPATPKEALKAVTPLDEVAAAKERAIAGERAPGRGTNVLIEAEKAATEAGTQQGAPTEVPATPKPTAEVRAKKIEELVDIDRAIEEKRAKGEDVAPEIERIENIRQEGIPDGAIEKPRRGTVTERLTELEDIAKVRLGKRLKKGGTTLRSGLDPTVGIDIARNLGDLSIIGAAKIAKGAVEFGKWSQVMLEEWGDDIRPHLEAIYEKSKERFHAIRARYVVLEHGEYYKSISMPE